MGKHPAPKKPNPRKFTQHLYWLYQPDKTKAGTVIRSMTGRRYTVQTDGSIRCHS